MGGGDLPEILIFFIVPKNGGDTPKLQFLYVKFLKSMGGAVPNAMCLSKSVIETLFDYKIAIICIIKEHKSYFKINALSAFV